MENNYRIIKCILLFIIISGSLLFVGLLGLNTAYAEQDNCRCDKEILQYYRLPNVEEDFASDINAKAYSGITTLTEQQLYNETNTYNVNASCFDILRQNKAKYLLYS